MLRPNPSSRKSAQRTSLLNPIDCSKLMDSKFEGSEDINGDKKPRRSFCTSDKLQLRKSITNSLTMKGNIRIQFFNKNQIHCFKVLQRRPPMPSIVINTNNNQLESNQKSISYYDFSTKKVDFKEAILENTTLRELFYQFVKSERSEENLEFYMEIEKFKKLGSNTDELKERCKYIYEEYLKNGSAKMINVDYNTVKQAQNCLSNPTTDMFDRAQIQVINLMQSDSLSRFLSSSVYREMIEFPHLYFDTVIRMPADQNMEKISKVQRFFEKCRIKSSNLNLAKKYTSDEILFVIPECTPNEVYDNQKTGKMINIYSNQQLYTYFPKLKKTLKNALQYLLSKDEINKNIRCFNLPFLSLVDSDSDTTTLNGQTLITRIYSNFKLLVGEKDLKVYNVYAPSEDIIGDILTTVQDYVGIKLEENIFYQAPDLTICLSDRIIMYQGWVIKVEKTDQEHSENAFESYKL